MSEELAFLDLDSGHFIRRLLTLIDLPDSVLPGGEVLHLGCVRLSKENVVGEGFVPFPVRPFPFPEGSLDQGPWGEVAG